MILNPNWSAPPDGDIELHKSSVHFWRATVTPTRDFSVLSFDEARRAERIRDLRERQLALTARCVLRSILGRYLRRPPREVVFHYGQHGKPSLPGEDLQFNLSHSRPIMLFAMSRRRVGVDLERINPAMDFAAVAEEIGADPRLGPVEITRLWTQHEAARKATGEGFGGEAQAHAADQWQTWDVQFDPDYAAALMTEGTDNVVECFDADRLG